MKTQNKKTFFIFLALLQLISLALIVPVTSQEAVTMQVNRAVWGQSLSAPVKVYPGDEGVMLIIEVQNLSQNSTIKGISGVLSLDDTPFTNIYGNPKATSTGIPSVGDLLNPSDQVASMSFFTLTFHLNIKEGAAPDTYQLPLEVTYTNQYLLFSYTYGLTQSLTVPCTISQVSSAIAVSASPAQLDIDEQMNLLGSLQPAVENANINLAFKGPNGNKFSQTVTTRLDGSFNYSYIPEAAGFWTVNASWLGDTQHSGSWASTSFEVHQQISLSLSVSGDRLKAGFDNQVNITLTNDGKVPFSSLNVSYTIPPPLVSSGKTQWTVNSLGAGENVTFPIVLYAPFASIGNTLNSGCTVICHDEYGKMQSYQFSVGLVTVGNVELGVYDSVVKPEVGVNGSKVEITTTLLNRGNVPALYVNATILPNAVLNLTSESSVYVGDVDANSQAPFTLSANVTENAKNGIYPITLRIDYRNDQNLDNSFNYTFNLEVNADSQLALTQNAALDLPEVGLIVAVIVVAAGLISLLYRRQTSKRTSIRA
jgi:hypothetical protein